MPDLEKAYMAVARGGGVRNEVFRLSLAIDRDNRLNMEEQEEYERTKAELTYGRGFFARAHP